MSMQSGRIRPMVSGLVALAAVVAIWLSGAASPAIARAEESGFATLSLVEDTTVRLTLTNTTSTDLRVPEWATGASGLSAPLFTVTQDGQSLPYIGRLAKFASGPQSTDVILEPGRSANWDLDLSEAYAWEPGVAQVLYRVVLEGGREITSNTVTVEAPATSSLDTRPSSVASEGGGVSAQSAYAYVTCTADQESAIQAALAAAGTYATTADAYFTSGLSGARYREWFGAYDNARWTTVAAHFRAIRAYLSGNDITFTCLPPDCSNDTFAYVYPQSPNGIFLCGAFFAASTTGTDSKAGTLIHEISHFTTVASTQDNVYGQGSSRTLATTTPASAVTNADSHEYFAENTPDVSAAYTVSTPTDFGSIERGSESTMQIVTFTSSGPSPLVVTSAAATGDYAIYADGCAGSTLAQNATCTVALKFAPTASGTRTGTLGLSAMVDVVAPTVSLTGTGNVAVTGVSLDVASATLDIGSTAQLAATVTPADASTQTITWSSSATSIATVNGNGLVTAVSTGSATITGTTTDGDFMDTSAITVNPLSAPGASTSVTGTAGDGQATVSWTPPASTGGSPITGYTVNASPGAATCFAATTTCVVSGLTNGQAYTFTVVATNAIGPGAASTPSAAVTPAAAPQGGGSGSGGSGSGGSSSGGSSSSATAPATITASPSTAQEPARTPEPETSAVQATAAARPPAMSIAQAAKVTPGAAARVTSAQFAAWRPSAISALRPSAFAALAPRALATMSPAQASAVTRAQGTRLRPSQIAALSPEQIRAIGLHRWLRQMNASQRRAVRVGLAI